MINIAFLGYGTVAHGAYNIINKKKSEIKAILGEEVVVKKILKRNTNGVTEDGRDIFTSDYNEILEDGEISLVVEMTGDLKASYEYISQAFKHKKHVVSANKAVVSEYFNELHSLAYENGVSFLYEAAVGGSIPIVTPLMNQVILNKVNRIRGILNGTSNYLLSRMYDDGISYLDVLKDAQDLGYAESDPYDDVEGVDTLRKLAILSTIAFKGVVKNQDILRFGISNIKDVDIKYLKNKNLKIKLMAKSVLKENKFSAVVEPVILNSNDKLYNIDGADNSVEIFGENYSSLVFAGEGAGSLPTGNAIVTDIVDILRGVALKVQTTEKIVCKNQIESEYYVRVPKDFKFNEKVSSEELIGEYKILRTEKIDRNNLLNILSCEDYFIARYEI
ncbi:homoserine dehydrogenase [Peptoniphilus asaccharolyticus DSM 20463]|uniref:Homoserine dehydrogenase n=1 Tax=Peptoniphilus asaccharolyticus DSM 20463 TaxID=573058 RepID=A0A1W1UJ34_PEPAS|nr:homoserine dehydrogenase [Peptoniphilus asaccharolyticus]MBL7574761.1 homoserine dehydrogenase [Peptoniphilus asaccharolyticus]SMB80764.1 homoserine dehydrogenase [Peptoniphilus asaccharolyticus DSM 20463]